MKVATKRRPGKAKSHIWLHVGIMLVSKSVKKQHKTLQLPTTTGLLSEHMLARAHPRSLSHVRRLR